MDGADDPAIDQRVKQAGDGRAVLVAKDADDREGAALRRMRGEVIGEHARGGLVVGDIQNPFDRARHGVEAAGELHAAQGLADDVLREAPARSPSDSTAASAVEAFRN